MVTRTDHAETRYQATFLGGHDMTNTIKRLRLAALSGLSVLGLTCASALAAQNVDQASIEVARNLAAGMCSSCHGPDGRSTNPAVPRLAGQQRSYIEVQLKSFRTQARGDPEAHDYMWGIAATLSDSVSAALAEYFSSQAPVTGTPGDTKSAASGKQLYEKAGTDRGALACSGCHGQNAEGKLVFPRLAGQHSQYLVRQMQMMRVKLRNSPVMHGMIKDLSDDDMKSLAAYLESR
jgi:cytochrome c553